MPLVIIGMLAFSVGISIDAIALYTVVFEIMLEVIKMQNNNDFWLGGACGAKNHGKYQLVTILSIHDTSTMRFDSSPSHQSNHSKGGCFFISRKVGILLVETLELGLICC